MQWAVCSGGKRRADPKQAERWGWLWGIFPTLYFCLGECKSLSSLAEGNGLDPSKIFRSIAFPLLHLSAGLGLCLMDWQSPWAHLQ